MEFLNNLIENGSSKAKTKAAQNFSRPITSKKFQSFSGLTGNFSKFILNFANIAKFLSDLLR